jgi:hypothetical protein
MPTPFCSSCASFLKGYTAVVGMRLVGLPFYFTSYDVTLGYLAKGLAKPELWHSLAAGGLAGMMFW